MAAKSAKPKPKASASAKKNLFALRKTTHGDAPDPKVHMIAKGIRCDTEDRGFPTPQGRSPLEIVVDASEGFIPLWAPDTTLRWRFRDRWRGELTHINGTLIRLVQPFHATFAPAETVVAVGQVPAAQRTTYVGRL